LRRHEKRQVTGIKRAICEEKRCRKRKDSPKKRRMVVLSGYAAVTPSRPMD
jgi:hypothetical protein